VRSETRSWLGTVGAAAVASFALHAGGLALAARLERFPPAPQEPVEVAFEAVKPPPPPPPPVRRESPAPPPPAEPKRVAAAKLPRPPRDEPPPPPPPPNEPPPKDAPPAKRAAPRVGVSISSTAEGGAFSVGVGNTLYGKAPEVAADPKDVTPYGAEGTAPPPRLSRQPRLVSQPEVPYPQEAKRAGIEGQVKLLLRIDAQGRVISARVLVEPGGGLGEAARAAALQLRFSPALLDGEPVELTDFPYTYTFDLVE